MGEQVECYQRVAAVQMASGPRVDANLQEIARLIAMAAEQGANLVVLPENATLMGMRETDKLAYREHHGQGPLQDFFAGEAARHGVWLVAGTIPLFGGDPERAQQTCLLYNDRGEQMARYDKVHLFDVDVEGDTRYQESRTLAPGEQVVVVDTPFGRLGLSICYDLRFPELYRIMADQGVELIVVPSAFTARTGEAHWRPLLRARAIENLSYVVAAAQGGYHVNGRETHGDSMIVDPWGQVLDHLGRGSGVVVSDLDLERLRKVRERFPALQHRRFHCHSDTRNA
ncbi:MAG: carbon-nitrogen hydrolase family protein [Ectothiorhodospiraceae bacterium]|nr:carbon-nitrogen hydrolase family protein [Ectothiorhodospiraceae bacterium]MCH8504400.1 carbon-nitrogen hydrolase family protein [Ectothiorhodospiraceae bacterium]